MVLCYGVLPSSAAACIMYGLNDQPDPVITRTCSKFGTNKNYKVPPAEALWTIFGVELRNNPGSNPPFGDRFLKEENIVPSQGKLSEALGRFFFTRHEKNPTGSASFEAGLECKNGRRLVYTCIFRYVHFIFFQGDTYLGRKLAQVHLW